MLRKNLHSIKISFWWEWWVKLALDLIGQAKLILTRIDNYFCVLFTLFLLHALYILRLKDYSCSCMQNFHLLGYVFFWSNKKKGRSFYLLWSITRFRNQNYRSLCFLNYWLSHFRLEFYSLLKYLFLIRNRPCHYVPWILDLHLHLLCFAD